MSPYVPWRDAWEHAHYGADGFYRAHSNPRSHFRTAVMDSELRRSQIIDAVHTHYRRIGEPSDFTVFDAGSGNAVLEDALRGYIFEHSLSWQLRSHNFLEGDVRDLTSLGGAGAVIAHELLDDIPCTIAELDDNLRGIRIDVDPHTGHERLGEESITEEEAAWLETWWPATVPAARREIGLTRDNTWRTLLGLFDTGCAIMIDYCTTQQERSTGLFDAGTLIGYQHGRATRPIPDGSMNITAHVAVESLIAVGTDLGKPAANIRRESAHSDFHWLVQPL